MTMDIDSLHAGQPMRNGLDPCSTCADWLALKAENDRLRKDAERYRRLRDAGSALKLYVYEDKDDPCSGDWQYKPSPEDVDAFADGIAVA